MYDFLLKGTIWYITDTDVNAVHTGISKHFLIGGHCGMNVTFPESGSLNITMVQLNGGCDAPPTFPPNPWLLSTCLWPKCEIFWWRLYEMVYHKKAMSGPLYTMTGGCHAHTFRNLLIRKSHIYTVYVKCFGCECIGPRRLLCVPAPAINNVVHIHTQVFLYGWKIGGKESTFIPIFNSAQETDKGMVHKFPSSACVCVFWICISNFKSAVAKKPSSLDM